MPKKLSWYERLFQSLPLDFPLAKTSRVFSTTQVEQDGRIVNTQIIQTIDPSKKFDGLKVNDFCIENVMAAGGEATLQPCSIVASTITQNVQFLDSAALHLNDLVSKINTSEND